MQQESGFEQRQLPNTLVVQVLGVISIFVFWYYGIWGLISGIVALMLAKQDLVRYYNDPDNYSFSSYKNLKAGRICAIVGIALSALVSLLTIALFIAVATGVIGNELRFFQ
ncbi:CCC motif membrane protein [Cytophagaceae bacterium YF14B1]|uniref:CCC motif membrane protein n=1 Tax=Xanthocytophaga flava TaxID=3048013 RepID=A0AAE3QHI2_9BACT|nr:CCC motif membrane protein [Xanthocytophaga flavus]MDJ1472049.1 CCC motif membrane protein [Xanthocytophaga flavus]MDJ1479487.1 CCC motif membrane protein [Xanthocytophaga flavus]